MSVVARVTPQVSVILPAWNAAATLGRAIESVQAQTLTDWELWVVVDAATDDTLAVAQAYAQGDRRIQVLVNDENLGVGRTRNRALEWVHGQYVAFLDSDDLWLPHKLERQCTTLRQTGAAVCYTVYRRFDAQGTLNVVVPPLRVTYAQYLRGNVIGLSSGMLLADLARQLRFERIGHEDYLFWLQALQQVGEARRVPGESPLMEYCVRPDSLSSNVRRNVGWQWAIYRRHLGLPWLRAVWLMGHYGWRALAKRRLHSSKW